MLPDSARKSSYCGNTTCVYVDMESTPGIIYVYDVSENRCTFTEAEWLEFIRGVKDGEFNTPS